MHIPLEKLPPDLQEKIISYLHTDNFQAAKRLRDAYEAHLQETEQQKPANRKYFNAKLSLKSRGNENVSSAV